MKSLLIASLLLSMAFAAMEDVQTETSTFIPLIDIQPDQVVTNIQQPYHVSTTISADRQDLESLDFSDGDSYSFRPSSSYEDQSSDSYERRGPRRSFRGSRNHRRGQDSESSDSSSGSYSSGSSDSSYASSDSYSGYSDDSSSSPSYGSYGSYDGSYEGSYDDSDYSGSDYSSDSSSDSSSSDSSDSDSSRGHGRFNHKGWRGQKKFGRKYGHHQEGKENHGQGQTEPRGPRGPKGPKGPIDPFKRQVFETLRNIGHTVQEWQNAETAEQKNQIRDQAIQQFSTLLPIVDEVQASTINMRFAQEFARPAPNPEQNEIRTQLHQVAVRIFTEWQQATEVTIKNQIREELIQQVSALFPQN